MVLYKEQQWYPLMSCRVIQPLLNSHSRGDTRLPKGMPFLADLRCFLGLGLEPGSSSGLNFAGWTNQGHHYLEHR